ncbi:MAG: hypothetical protein ACLTKI_03965 [Lachnospiraceae bacterium]
MACIKQMAGKVGQKELNSMYLVLDMPEQTGSIPEQLEQIYRCLETQFRYDGDRLRNR